MTVAATHRRGSVNAVLRQQFARATHTGCVHLNPIDLLLLGIVAVGALAGWARGFVLASVDLLALAASLAAAFFGYRPVSHALAPLLPSLSVWLPPLSFIGLFVLVQFALGSAALRSARRIPTKVHTHAANRVLGIAPGAVTGAMHAVVAAVLVTALPLGARVGGWSHDSVLAARFTAPAEWVVAELAPVFDAALRRSLRGFGTSPEAERSIALAFRVRRAEPRPDLEASMLQMVNAERRAAGLQPVQADPRLTEVARAHSRDMFARGYFSHTSPEGRDLGDRMQQARVGYLAAGENLALAPTLAGAHTGLMHSPGHRANILRPQFGRVGIGVLDGGVHGLMVTQDFRN